MGMATEESDIDCGTDVGKWGAKGAGNFCFGLPKGDFSFPPHVSILQMLRFLWRSQMWVKNVKKKSTP